MPCYKNLWWWWWRQLQLWLLLCCSQPLPPTLEHLASTIAPVLTDYLVTTCDKIWVRAFFIACWFLPDCVLDRSDNLIWFTRIFFFWKTLYEKSELTRYPAHCDAWNYHDSLKYNPIHSNCQDWNGQTSLFFIITLGTRQHNFLAELKNTGHTMQLITFFLLLTWILFFSWIVYVCVCMCEFVCVFYLCLPVRTFI